MFEICLLAYFMYFSKKDIGTVMLKYYRIVCFFLLNQKLIFHKYDLVKEK